MGRRDLFSSSAAMLGGALLGKNSKAEEAQVKNVNTNSSPSTLKITDLRVAPPAVGEALRPAPVPSELVGPSSGSTPTRAFMGWGKSATAPAPLMHSS